MEFDLHTFDIQNLIIALVYARDNIKEEDKTRLDDKLCELNRMCNEGNNYTLKVKIEA